MAVLPTAQWWIRAGGNELNGGGFNSAISGAGTNYADQDAAVLTKADFATPSAGSTTLTSASGSFTSAMIGNCVRIASGTNFQAGYYFITAYTSGTQVTLDRTASSSAAGSSGTGRVGGAWATVKSAASGAAAPYTAPLLSTPVIAGNTVNIRGSGSDDPATADYSETGGGYYTIPAGDDTSGPVKWIGYNGRPRLDHQGMLFYSSVKETFENISSYSQGTNYTYGFLGQASHVQFKNCLFDQNGYDTGLTSGSSAIDCVFRNTGSTTAGASRAFFQTDYFGVISACTFDRLRGVGAYISYGGVEYCIFKGLGSHAIELVNSRQDMVADIKNNSIYSCGGDGIRFTNLPWRRVYRNIIHGCSGYGINVTSNYAGTLNSLPTIVQPSQNAFRSNTSGNYNNWSGTEDITLSADPFVDAAGGNFMLNNAAGGGALLKSIPKLIKGSNTSSYASIGAAEIEKPTADAIAQAAWAYANRTLT